MTDYTVDKNIPLPEHDSKYPFGKMEIGDSFELDESERNRLQATARRLSSGKEPKKFTFRSMSDRKVRCWRIE